MEAVIQETSHIRVDCIISFFAQSAAARSVTLTGTHAKIRSAVGASVGGALFDHLIL